MSNHYIRLLRDNPDFARLWWAQVISLLGDWFNFIVLAALVADYSDGSGQAISVYLLARFLPPLFVSPFAGVLVDRFDRKRLLIISDLLRAGIVPLFLLANSPDLLWLIYLLTVLQFAVSAIFEPGRNAIMPALIPREDLVIANTLSSVTWSVMLAVGAVAGGLVSTGFGTSVALLTDAATFLLSALLIMGIRVRYRQQVVEALEDEHADDRSFREGLRYMARNPSITAILLVKTILSLGNIDTAIIIFGTELFVIGDGGTISLSLLWSAFGIGAVIGPAVANRFNDGSIAVMRRLIIAGYGCVVVGWLLFGSAPTLLFAALALMVRACGGSINWTYSSIIIQKGTRDEYLGRMFAMDMAGFHLMMVISIILTGQIVDAVGSEHIRVIVLGTGFLSLTTLLLWMLMVRRLETRESLETTVATIGS